MSNQNPVNMHEMLKRQIFSEDITPHSRNPANEKGKYMQFAQNIPYSDQTFGISDNYLLLDSFLKNPSASNLARGEISWNIQIQGSNSLLYQTIGSRNLLGNVIEVELGSFYLPLLKEVPYIVDTSLKNIISHDISLIQNNASSAGIGPYLQKSQIPSMAPPNIPDLPSPMPPTPQIPWLNNPLSQTPFGNRISIQLKEAGIQAYNGGFQSSLFHFMYQLQYNTISNGTSPNLINAIPMENYSNKFVFTDPILDFPSISLVFRNPDFPLFFEPDIIECRIFCDFTIPIPLIGGNYFLSFFFEGHNLLTEDRIFLKNFNSGYGALDAYINNNEGLLVGYPPDIHGVSQNIPTGTQITEDIFYLDPFVVFNHTFTNGTISTFTGKMNAIIIIVKALIIYPFGATNITFNINNNDPLPITINGIFSIGAFSGTYDVSITSIDASNPNNVIITVDPTTTGVTLKRLHTSSNVYIAKRRLILPIKLRTVLNKVTNYITPI